MILFKCSVGKHGLSKKKKKGIKKHQGNFSIENLYFRKDRIKNQNFLKTIELKDMDSAMT